MNQRLRLHRLSQYRFPSCCTLNNEWPPSPNPESQEAGDRLVKPGRLWPNLRVKMGWLTEILALNEDYVSKRHTCRVEQALVKAISTKSANPKQPSQSQQSQQKQAYKKKGKAK